MGEFELKPCPFCGGNAHLDFAHGSNQSYLSNNGFAKSTPILYMVFCDECYTRTIWRSCDNCDNYQCYKRIVERGIDTKKPCSDWSPILCRCGGTLSEIREHNGRKYRHCYACHFEFEEK